MPLSHLTLTVSQLPQSTSFFLSCLQPLGYHFIGRHEDYIGFGSQPGEPADFWITEEKPGVPAGAAHVAFPAPSKDSVGSFFIQALKAGGKIHGEPKVRDADSGYFSAAVIDFDGNSIEAVYRPGSSSSRSAAGGRALTVIKGGSVVNGGSVVSRVKSTRTESVYSSARSDFNKLGAPESVVDIDRAPPSTVSYSMYQQQAYQPQQQKADDGSKTAKTIIGTLIGATAGAAIAYAMTREASSSQSTPEPQYTISAAPAPAPAQSRVQEYQGTRAIEAGPAHSFYSDEDASTVYSRSKAPSKAPSKIARASTIYEGSEYYPVDDRAESVYSEQSGIQRTANGSVYATKDLPIRAIEFPPQGDRRSSVPGHASSFISSFVDKSFHGNDDRSVCSSSTIKAPRRASADDHASQYSSRHSSYSRPSPSHHQSAPSVHEYAASVRSSKGPGSTYSTRTAREVPLPGSSIASFKSEAKSMRSAKDIPLPAGSTVSASSYRSDAKSMRSAKDIPLPTGSTISASSYRTLRSAKDIPLPDSASTVYHDTLDVDSHVTPDDSISQVGGGDSRRSTTRSTSRSHTSHRSKSRSHASHASKRSSKFDEPVKPSDSVSQVSTNVSRASQRTIKADDTRSKASSRRE
ncbi:hypothetical protein Plec18170_006226 [Paecilomyces lecythidis]